MNAVNLSQSNNQGQANVINLHFYASILHQAQAKFKAALANGQLELASKHAQVIAYFSSKGV